MRYNIGYFILSHGRPDKVLTYDVVRDLLPKEHLYIVIDDQDKTGDEYRSNYDNVITFCKADRLKLVDTCDTNKNPKNALCVRSFIIDEAIRLGYDYAFMLDDDITNFKYRYVNEAGTFKSDKITNLVDIIDELAEFAECSSSINLLSFSHSSFYAGGKDGMYSRGLDIVFSQAMLFKLSSFKSAYFRGLEEDFNITITDIEHLHYNVTSLCVESPAMNSESSVISSIAKGNRAMYSYIIYPPCVDVLANGKRRLHRENFIPKLVGGGYKK